MAIFYPGTKVEMQNPKQHFGENLKGEIIALGVECDPTYNEEPGLLSTKQKFDFHHIARVRWSDGTETDESLHVLERSYSQE